MSDKDRTVKTQFEIRKEISDALDRVKSGKKLDRAFKGRAEELLNWGIPAIRGDDRWALAETLKALDMALQWVTALEVADEKSKNYQDAARFIARKALEADRHGNWSQGVIGALEILRELNDFAQLPLAVASVRRAPLVLPSTNLVNPQETTPRSEPEEETTEQPTVLFHLTLNGEPISWPIALQTGMSYRIGATARLEEWPENLDHIRIDWECAAPSSVLERTGLCVDRDGGCTDTGYLLARAEIPPNQSVALNPVATIHNTDGISRSARIVGQSFLRVNTFAPSEIGAGLPMVNQRIVELLAELDAKIPGINELDRLNLLHLLDATSRFAALAIERNDLLTIDEKGFQAVLKQAFVMDPRIGKRVLEGSEVGGGETDLMIERVVNELKVSKAKVDFASADRFLGQPTHYASAGDCPISVLTILDQSEKRQPPGVQSNFMRWAYPQIHSIAPIHTPSMVAIVIIPVGFPIPSEWSRRAGSRN